MANFNNHGTFGVVDVAELTEIMSRATSGHQDNAQTVEAAGAAPQEVTPSRTPIDVDSLAHIVMKPVEDEKTSTTTQTTERMDGAKAAKLAMEEQDKYTQHSRNLFTTTSGIDMMRKHEESQLRVLSAAEKLKEARQQSPVLTYLLGDAMHVTANAEMQAALQEESTYRNYLMTAKATRSDALTLIDNIQNQWIKNLSTTAAGNPDSQQTKEDRKTVLEAITAAYNEGASNVEVTEGNANMLVNAALDWINGKPNMLLGEGAAMAVVAKLRNTDVTTEIDMSMPYSSIVTKMQDYTPNTFKHNQLLMHSMRIEQAYLSNPNLTAKEQKAFKDKPLEERAQILDKHFTQIKEATKANGIQTLWASGLPVNVQDAGTLMEENFDKYGIDQNDFIRNYLKQHKVTDRDGIVEFNSNLLENTRKYLQELPQAERAKANSAYASLIADSYRAQKEIMEKSKTLFFSLNDVPYNFPVASRAFKPTGMFGTSRGSINIDFTNSAQVAAFLSAPDYHTAKSRSNAQRH